MGKKILLFSFLFFILSIFVVRAETSSFQIKDVSVIEHGGFESVEKPSFSSDSIQGITFNQINQFITYEIVLKNISIDQYKIYSIVDNNTSDYIKITYDFEDKLVTKDDTTKITVKISYVGELINVQNITLDDLVITMNMSREDGKTEQIIINNPFTGDYHIFVPFILLFLLLLIGMAFSIFSDQFVGRRLGNAFVAACFVLFPFIGFAIERYDYSISIHNIEIMGRMEIYNVVIDPNNGESPILRNIQFGDFLGELPIPEKNGYTFLNWEDENHQNVTEETIISGPLNVYAVYECILYTISYQLDGGDADNPSSYTIESDDIILNNPSKLGYTFSGWTGSNGKVLQTRVTIEHGSVGNREYIAHYSANDDTQYRVIHKYPQLDGSYQDVVEVLYGVTDSSVSPAVMERDGFISPVLQIIVIQADGSSYVEYYYTRRKYSFSITDRTYVDSSTTLDGEYEYETIITLKANARSGYSFLWSDNDNRYERSFRITQDTSLTPNYIPNTNTSYKVVHRLMNIDGVTSEIKDEFIYSGTTDTTVRPSVNYYVGFVSPEAQDLLIKGDGTSVLEYYYSREQYTFQITDRTYVDESVSTPNGVYPYEYSIIIKAIERPGYSFKWNDDNTSYSRAFLIDSDVIFTPIYTPDTHTAYTVIHKKMKLDETYEVFEVEHLTGTTDTKVTPSTKNYTGFVSPETVEINIDGDGSRVLEYLYERMKYQFSIVDRTYVNSSTTLNGSYYYGTEIHMSAINRAGYSFEWSDHNSSYNRIFELDEDTTFELVYTPHTNTAYKVVHKQMNLDGETYSIKEEENLTGETDSTVTPTVKVYEGFISPEAENLVILGDGSAVLEYYYVRRKYTLTLENVEYIDTIATSGEYYYGTTFLLTAVNRTGYLFKWWSTGETNQELLITITDNLTIGPVYREHEYIVVYDSNGGEGSMINLILHWDISGNLNKNLFTRYHHKFLGWNTEEDGSGTSFTDEQEVLNLTTYDTITLYAQWEREYYITYDFNTLNDMNLWSFNGKNRFTVVYDDSSHMNNVSSNGQTGTWEIVYMSIDTIPGESYTFSFDYVNPNGYTTYNSYEGIPIQILRRVDNSNNSSNQIERVYLSPAVNSDTERISITFVAQNSISYLAFNFGYGDDGRVSTIQLGNFELIQKKEALVAIGSIPNLNMVVSTYGFDAYYSTPNNGTKLLTTTLMPEDDLTYYARYGPSHYTVLYQANGGYGDLISTTIAYGETGTILDNSYVRDYFTFVGWNTQDTGLGTWYSVGSNYSNLTSTNNGVITLYAIWKSNYHLIHDFNTLNDMTKWSYYYPEAFNISYDNSTHMNQILFNSLSGWENIYMSLNLVVGKRYSFEFDYYNPNGFTSGYDGIAVHVLENNTSGNNASNYYLLRYIPKASNENMVHVSMEFIASKSTMYLSFNFGYVTDGTSANISIGNMKLLQDIDPKQAIGSVVSHSMITGYSFNGYFTSPTGGDVLQTSTVAPVSDMVYYAQYELNHYTIQFNANGGSQTMEDMVLNYNQSVTLPNNSFTREYYHFVTWNTKADGSGTSYQEGQTIINMTTSNNVIVPLYAIWKSDYDITYDFNTINDMNMWSFVGKNYFTINYDSSTYMNQITVNSVTGTWENVYLPISTVSGKKYYLEFDYYHPTSYTNLNSNYPGIGVQILKKVTNSNNTSNQISVLYLSKQGSNDVEHITLTFTAVGTTTYLDFNFGYVADGTTATVNIGHFQLKYEIVPYTAISSIPTPTLATGYTFNGYYSNRSGGDLLTTSTLMPENDITYYAQSTSNVSYRKAKKRKLSIIEWLRRLFS